MILSAQSVRKLSATKGMIDPFVERGVQAGRSFGLSCHGYDIRVAETLMLPPGAFSLASTIERFRIPTFIAAVVHDKSSWARLGLSVFNTVAEAGWEGWLTLELANRGHETLFINEGDPIAQMMFHLLDEETEQAYSGKYMNQEAGPQPARFE
jgi:dCTP deaminase